MIVCEKEFDIPDPIDPNYSLPELDFYAHIPYDKAEMTKVQNHRLSLRKNLITGNYEVYRAYNNPQIIGTKHMTAFTHHETGYIDVAFKSKSLREALDFADSQVEFYHSHRDNDELCEHVYPKRATLCPVGKDYYESSIIP